MSLFKSEVFDNNTPNLAEIINNTNVGVWEYDLQTKNVRWSVGFYRVLGYEPGDIECSYTNFIDNLLYFQDRKDFLRTANLKQGDTTETIFIRLLTKNGYQWFQSSIQKQTATTLTGTLININRHKITQLQLSAKQKQYAEANKIARSGNWEIEAANQKLSLSKEAYEIFELQLQHALSIEEFIDFIEPDYRTAFHDAIKNSIQYSRPFELDLQLNTAKNNLIWVKIKAITIIDDFGNCLKVKGILQNIDQSKNKEIELRSSLDLVKHHNSRLQNFAYIIAHNLNSHAKNLRAVLSHYEEADRPEERQELFSHIKTISQSLTTTIEHVNEIVKIESEIGQEKQQVSFNMIYENVISSLENEIFAANAAVSYDFSNCPEVDYIPAYLESIFHNLLTNSLKYRHPQRQAVIKCETKKEDSHVYLIFEDNGLGIDMELYGQYLFGLYQTFHENNDAKGIGLFITRNQVEALGGTIQVDSTVNVGTKFTITLT